MKILKPIRFGNPILRQTARKLTKAEILSPETQTLVKNIRHTLIEKKYGVGLAAPQVGESIALSVIGIKSTPTRPNNEPLDMVIINPKILETYGNRTGMWEGCISCGVGNGTVYAKALRYRKIKLLWNDERAERHEAVFEGLPAHVIQHETDHLNGVLFVDKVRDTTTYMMADEYRKRIVKRSKTKK